MTPLLHGIRRHAYQTPESIALKDEQAEFSYRQLVCEIDRQVDQIVNGFGAQRIGLLLDNGIPWACLDLAILQAGRACIPMPLFFTTAQLDHLIRDADLDLILTDQPDRLAALLTDVQPTDVEVTGRNLAAFRRSAAAHPRTVLPPGTAKVTYTSGTTGQPKGVCLPGDTLEAVTATLCHAVNATPTDRALSLLPLSTLLENIAGLYAPLWRGAQASIPSLDNLGMTGSVGLDVRQLMTGIATARPTTLVVVPQLLKALVGGVQAGMPLPDSIRFIAVGGAAVSESLLQQAGLLGMPVYQGFGLSEAGSVVSLNLPGATRMGSVGKPLPHIDVSIAEDGEVIVRGPIFLGYLGATDAPFSNSWPTGDLGHLDEDGYLFLHGRKKTAYATAHGRNVAPEWVEATLTAQPGIAQAAVFGAGQPFNVALIVPGRGTTSDGLQYAIARANDQLPDYARIRQWIVVPQVFTTASGLANADGSVRRSAIESAFHDQINTMFDTEEVSHELL